MTKLLKNSADMEKTLQRMIYEMLERHETYEDIVFVGIRTRGVFLAQRLKDKFEAAAKTKVMYGELDITLYRDDLSQVADYPVIKGTNINFDITDKTIILVDDVLYTGRTIRAALSELADLGRPGKVELAVLIDRGHREVPISADYAGKIVPTSKKEVIHVRLAEHDGVDEVVLGVKDAK
ncbi:pyrimidine operon attenuation protein/uracil phosphoribosyltransferase [Elusimicrobium simillimum]|uniref:bifunctional pyr operon transcriptional regulator/uracil phosphoribosyltransferase PyrR n=1 Tax=Elusimicrobium simillimum TaxID=3143438 RepID=UPI003C6F693C